MLVSDECLKTCAEKALTGTGMLKPSTRPARPLPSLAMICDARIKQFRTIRKTNEAKAAGITVRQSMSDKGDDHTHPYLHHQYHHSHRSPYYV